MTVVTTRDFRANQSKYIKMAQRGEKVVLTSRLGDVQLTPVPNEDAFEKYFQSKVFQRVVKKARKDFLKGKTTRCENLEELHSFLEAL